MLRHLSLLLLLALVACSGNPEPQESGGEKHADAPDLTFEGETHLTNVRQLTYGGENAEAYFSFDDSQLIFQATRGSLECDQIFVMPAGGGEPELVSTGEGRCTCAYFLPGNETIIFSSTHEASPDCPPKPDYSQGYVWPIYEGYEIYRANADGSDLQPLAPHPGYDAEATVSRDGRIVFTSVRDGDLDLYTMNADGSDLKRITDEVGYDGGAFFSNDGTRIVYRAHHPRDPKKIADYKRLLDQGLIRPTQMDLFICDADGGNKRQITDNGAANFAPFWCPDDERIIFASNLHNPRGRNFDLYLINVDGTGLERVTTCPDFDGFPMFSWDGKKLVWGSNRHNKKEGDTNIFIADWQE